MAQNPATSLDAYPSGIQTLPGLIRFAMAALVFALKAIPIFATGSPLAGKTGRGWTVEDTITFDPQQARRLDVDQASQERRAGRAAVPDNDGMQATSHQQGHDGTQLALQERNAPEVVSFGYIPLPRQSLTRIAEVNLSLNAKYEGIW